ncbi:Bystin-domain-containing protein [Dimargaris cristalligena]|uniref:Bystin n=1 Tax=Dimargaris cristalligena TaxID=215637 RepID=A0A4P9ZWD4_9FUNG|nr:Bystin-domain-containing protein [Dimargaris cristalligena]|eukprot:RKP37966.1 Bystin-domain-containing protein [Dimargaris cristalligena]
MGKVRNSRKQRQDPLYKDMVEGDEGKSLRQRAKFALREEQREDQAEDYVSAELSSKILRIAKEQQLEVDGSDFTSQATAQLRARGAPSHDDNMATSDEEEDEDVVEYEYESGADYDGDYRDLEIDESDQHVMSKFLPDAPAERQTLADIIMSKIDEANARRGGANASADPPAPRVHPKVREVYTKVGTILSRYKSGPLPKAFKIAPSIPHWEEIVMLTEPDNWTPNATYEAVKIFVHGLGGNKSSKMLEYVLLDKVRQDIGRNKKLNYHLYMALKKAVFRPEAFFKGIIFPLCKAGNCTLREAVIIGSVLTKVSLPALHSSSALMKLCQMDYSGPNSLFIRILLDKKYALPFKVIDALVFHFLGFKTEKRQLPVLWHQALLTLVQRYRSDLSPDQKDALLNLLKYQFHEVVSPEIRREIQTAVCRDQLIPEAMMELA